MHFVQCAFINSEYLYFKRRSSVITDLFTNLFFRFDGLLVSVVGIIGFVGNSLALLVLSRPSLRDVFHQLLFALACFDILYIVCGGVNYTFK